MGDFISEDYTEGTRGGTEITEERDEISLGLTLWPLYSLRVLCVTGFGKSDEVSGVDEHVDQLDASERNEDAAETVDHEVAAQHRSGADRPVGHTA